MIRRREGSHFLGPLLLSLKEFHDCVTLATGHFCAPLRPGRGLVRAQFVDWLEPVGFSAPVDKRHLLDARFEEACCNVRMPGRGGDGQAGKMGAGRPTRFGRLVGPRPTWMRIVVGNLRAWLRGSVSAWAVDPRVLGSGRPPLLSFSVGLGAGFSLLCLVIAISTNPRSPIPLLGGPDACGHRGAPPRRKEKSRGAAGACNTVTFSPLSPSFAKEKEWLDPAAISLPPSSVHAGLLSVEMVVFHNCPTATS